MPQHNASPTRQLRAPRLRNVLYGAGALCCALPIGHMTASAAARDYGKITCGAFLASGKDNMAYIIWWLRGYHAGKTGVSTFESADPYAGRLGFYCHNHPSANLIETSEQILSSLDRGI